MLKQKIDKAAFDALKPDVQAEYKVNPSNAAEYVLDTEEAREAIAARDREKARADALQAQIDGINEKLTKAEKDKQDLADEAARKKGDTTALDASWQKKLDDANAAADVKITKLNDQLKALLVKAEARKLAAEISTVPDLLAPAIEARLSADLTGDLPITRVLDAAGKPSASSIDELRKEFVANPNYAAIIKANDASGGGAGGGSGGGGAPGKKFSQLTETERVALSRANPAEYKRLSDAHRAEAHAAKG